MTPLSKHFYKLMLPNYCLSLLAFFILLSDFKWIYLLYMICGFYMLGVFGNTIGFHRYLTHQSFNVNKFWHYTFVILGSLSGQGSAIFWTGLHLHHHRTADTELDVHSPEKGFWASTWGWQFLGNLNVKGFIAPRRLYKDNLIKFLHYQYYKVYWIIFIIVSLIDWRFALFFITIGGFLLVSLADNISNYCFHSDKFGYRNFDTNDNSRNIPFVSWLAAGAGWHNNHHHNPGSYSFSSNKKEFDLGSHIIDLIKKS